METNLNRLKYPIGEYFVPEVITPEMLAEYIQTISAFPQKLRREVQHLNDLQLDTTYRPGGWTIRQVVHHCADSHMNSLIRFKLALTEENPVIKPYFEDRWAELSDTKHMPVAAALLLLEGLHAKWTVLLQSLTPKELERTYFHPEQNRSFRLDEVMGVYDWHCRHHLAHIVNLKTSRDWK
jgi:hypothetical protein